MNFILVFFDFFINSFALVSVTFALFSVLIYLIIQKLKNEKYQFFTAIACGFFLVAVSSGFSGISLTGEITRTIGTVLILIAPLIVFKRYLHTKDELIAVFLISVLYPAYFRSSQYQCGGPAMVGYYPWYVAVLGDCIGPLILSLAAVSTLIVIRRVYEKLKPGKCMLIIFGLLIPATIWFTYAVASASVAVLILIILNACMKDAGNHRDFRISAGMIISAVVIALPWNFLAGLPCIRNFFPIWIIPVLAVSVGAAAPLYYIQSKIPEKWMEISAFTLCFIVSVMILPFTGLIS
ncbi:hypothetical protein L0665_05145 [Methanogenium marinum]|uniref:Uncharacterized protein n=1 Tax=Methanogenium marinum TaxID=348610 RepID=A0A9Q4PY47_9EURY|nr:hypothetical protein [Methanogenium marinum]MDE4907993.1 hypothetical protein [Methanogenium marinum]